MTGTSNGTVGYIISTLLGIIVAGGSLIWAQQREQIRELHAEVSQLQHDVGELHGTDGISQLDRVALHEQLNAISGRQQRVIGVLGALAPNATAAILKDK